MTRVNLYNPLPRALFHYHLALCELLCDIGIDVVKSVTVDGEPGGHTRDRAIALSTHLCRSLAEARTADATIVLWPLLGWWECLVWAGLPPNFVVFHDPTPLRKQPGMTSTAKAVARSKLIKNQPTIVTHSQDAMDVARLTVPSLRTVALLHPVRLPTEQGKRRRHSRRTRVGVFGQFKGARDVDVLRGLSALNATNAYDLQITGRGWPPITGWAHVGGFVSENEFDRQMDAVDVVLLPYAKYYQSGVALRALERGIPVVGKATPFLRDLYGDMYPGLVRHSAVEDWLRAIDKVVALNIEPFRDHYVSRMHASWSEAMRCVDGNRW